MDQNGRRRGTPGRVGDANVLSDAATPNRLSTQAVRRAPVGGGSREPVPGSPGLPVPAGAAVRTRRGTPSFSTLLFFAFIAITALRVLGQVNAPSTVPGPVVTPVPEAATPGPGITEMPADVATVAFGTASDENCGVTGADVEFKAGTSVWWSAQLTTLQSGDSGAFVIIRRDGNEISSDKMPPAEPSETWDQLCSTDPVAETGIGTYRIEVWDLSISVVLAAGEYRVSV